MGYILGPRFMQELSAELCIPLTMIFEKSIETAQLPDQWKVARVSAIFKKGNKKLASNYRPVSITSIVCRTFEKIIRDHIVSFLMEHGLLSNFQFGFMKGRSTTLQLLNVLNTDILNNVWVLAKNEIQNSVIPCSIIDVVT